MVTEPEPVKHGLTDSQRAQITADLYQALQDFILDDSNEIGVSIDRGQDIDSDGLETVINPNRTATITVLVNGGASGTAYPQPGSSIDFGKE